MDAFTYQEIWEGGVLAVGDELNGHSPPFPCGVSHVVFTTDGPPCGDEPEDASVGGMLGEVLVLKGVGGWVGCVDWSCGVEWSGEGTYHIGKIGLEERPHFTHETHATDVQGAVFFVEGKAAELFCCQACSGCWGE